MIFDKKDLLNNRMKLMVLKSFFTKREVEKELKELLNDDKISLKEKEVGNSHAYKYSFESKGHRIEITYLIDLIGKILTTGFCVF